MEMAESSPRIICLTVEEKHEYRVSRFYYASLFVGRPTTGCKIPIFVPVI